MKNKMYEYEIQPSLKRILNKLYKKDKLIYERVLKKIKEIIDSYEIESYKNLRNDLKDYKRVHVGHFVLIFKFLKNENKIIFIDFDHHDNIYKK